MPTTSPPPPSPPPPRPATSPPTSPQRYQQAVRHQERLRRDMISPELRRTSSATLAASSFALPPAPQPQVSAPVTFNGRTFHHLPPNLAAAIGNLQPLRTSSRGQRHAAHPLPVSYFSYNFSLLC